MSLTHEKRVAPVKATLLPAERYEHEREINPVDGNNTRSDGESWVWVLFLSAQFASRSAMVGGLCA